MAYIENLWSELGKSRSMTRFIYGNKEPAVIKYVCSYLRGNVLKCTCTPDNYSHDASRRSVDGLLVYKNVVSVGNMP